MMLGILRNGSSDSRHLPFISSLPWLASVRHHVRVILGTALLLGVAVTASNNVSAASLDLANLQVFASGSISASRSDYQGTTVAGHTITLSDFDIGGNLIAGNSVTFKRGRVHGDIRSPHQQLDQVSGDFAGVLSEEDWTHFSAQLDELDQRISAMPATTQAVVTHVSLPGQSVTLVRVAASHGIDVVDLPDNVLRSASPNYVRLIMSGDKTSRLVVRIHGASPSLQNVGFSSLDGITPEQILIAFPDAKNVVIASSGGATGQDGEDWGIPASILAPHAGVRFAAARITGQVFVRDIGSIDGLPSGQINRMNNTNDPAGLLRELISVLSYDGIGHDGQPVLRRMYR